MKIFVLIDNENENVIDLVNAKDQSDAEKQFTDGFGNDEKQDFYYGLSDGQNQIFEYEGVKQINAST